MNTQKKYEKEKKMKNKYTMSFIINFIIYKLKIKKT
jgi:hypothetical protein